MTDTQLAARRQVVNVQLAAQQQAMNTQLAAWFRIGVWCLANADQHGHARAYTGELRRLLDTNAREVSRAIRLARERGLIDPCSSAACLVLPGHALAPCDAYHRDAA